MQSLNKICFVVASEMTVKAFLKQHIIALSEHYDVTLVVNTQQADFAGQNDLSVKVIPLVIERTINPVADLQALFRLTHIFRQHHFDLVHSVTPKAGLLAMLAGKIAGVHFRLHTFTGQVWATRNGFLRLLLKSMDRLLAASATHLLTDSFTQRQFLIDQKVTGAEKLSVLADGSISGVDVDRFMPNSSARSDLRKQVGISESEILLLFLGRLNRDKGVLDLAAAFAKIAVKLPRLHLLFVGPDEGNLQDAVKSTSAEFVQRVHFIDYTDKPESCFAAADIFCLPSYREGFGSVIIEAAACGVPAIGSRIYGISDAIREGQTGLLFEAGNSDQLAKEIEQLATNSTLRSQMGKAAFERARDDFSTKRLVQAWLDYYDGLQ
ncbi:glycosyltransferase family 4 protein [Mariprofundus ferrooxydans]|nr:glycosyltransferase family 4 protein [Mariprofundus ferrooxydans]KON47416.1 hypothetical protein AL013_07950 [Mariprofundus ferrooxydans]